MAHSGIAVVGRWGNAPAIRIPKTVMEKANLHEGDTIDFEMKAPGIVVVRVTRPTPTLEELVAGITSRNRHRETQWGGPQGAEIW